jgi:SAM-dependent methyltransferase
MFLRRQGRTDMGDSMSSLTVISAQAENAMERFSREQLIEVEFWRTSPTEGPDSNAVENILHKCAEARIFLRELRIHSDFFARASITLELGAGQAWASALVKREFPHLVTYASDISPYAVRSVTKWEQVFGSKVDRVFACPSNEIPLENESVDLVFCFQAAHHFRSHRTTLIEIRRVLKPGGFCLYLQEPCCPRFWYRLAYWRVNRKRPEVPEDVIVHRKLAAMAVEVGFSASYSLTPHTMNKGLIETIYYACLCGLKPLRYLLPCGADFIFLKQ